MGLFDNTDSQERDEVVIEAPEEDSSSGETRLGQEVEDSLINDSGSESGSRTGSQSSDVSLKDIHRQNQTIIDLLEKIVDDKKSSGRSRSSSSSRVTDRNSSSSSRHTSRSSSGSSRVTDREDSSDDDSIGDGMNELL